MEGLCENQLRLRACMYEMIASCLQAEPSQDTLQRWLGQRPYLEDLLMCWHEPTLRQSVLRFFSVVETSNVDDLAVDYAGLFLGAASGSVCPSESSYQESRLFGECTAEVRQFYARRGFVVDNSFTEPDDHVAVEYYFMSLLARASLAACDRRNRDTSSFRDHMKFQLLFLEEHLSRWIGMWATDVEKCSVTDFFKVIAELAVVIVMSDLDFLAALTEVYGFRR